MHRVLAAALLFALAAGPLSPAYGHKGHERNETAEAPAAEPENAVMPTTPAVVPPQQEAEATPPPSTLGRLLDWLGRLHPSVVHFPLAFLPAALFTAVMARKRAGLNEATRFLILAGGLTAPVAMLLGWLDGGWSLWDKDPIMAVHRWLGTAIGMGGLGLTAWTVVRPADVRGNAMLVTLVAMTTAILVQGWLGGALIHGVDHLAW